MAGNANNGANTRLYFQLGLHYLRSRSNLTEAVKYFQICSRTEPGCILYWECLGEAYLWRGSLLSSIKVFQRVIELKDKAIGDGHRPATDDFAEFCIAEAKRKLGYTYDACKCYEAILSKNPDNGRAWIGLAETQYTIADDLLKTGLYEKGTKYAIESLQVAVKAAEMMPNLCYPWKVATDACLLLCFKGTKVFDSQFTLNNTIIGKPTISTKNDLIGVCIKMIKISKSLNSNSPGLWHNLGICYYLKSIYSSGDDYKKLTLMSLKCYSKALSINGNENLFWNSMGILLARSDAFHQVTQHCFIKAITLSNSTTEMPWSNLGVFYLMQRRNMWANKAFSASQSQEPNYVNGWLGQALLAEEADDPEAVNILRHCNVIGCHAESQTGFGQSVVEQRISHPNFLNTATDSLLRHRSWDLDDFVGQNILGLIMEQVGNFRDASRFFQQALDKVPSHDSETYAKIGTNYLRSLIRSGNLKQVSPILKPFVGAVKATDHVTGSLAIAMYHAMRENYVVALQVFGHVITLLGSTDEKANGKTKHVKSTDRTDAILASMMIKRRMGNNVTADLVKWQSGHGHQLTKSGLVAMICIIIDCVKCRDENLLKSTVGKLFAMVRRYPPVYLIPICLVSLILPDRNLPSPNIVKSYIHIYPMSISLMFIELLRQMTSSRANIGSFKATYAKLIGMIKSFSTKLSPFFLTGCFAVASLMYIKQVEENPKSSLLMIQRAIHMNPDSTELWSIFLMCLKANKTTNVSRYDLFRQTLDISDSNQKEKIWSYLVKPLFLHFK